MKKKIISLITAGILGVSVLAVPMLAMAEESVTYVEHSDFNDCSIGGNKGTGYYGLGIIIDGSPWLSKGSASVHYQTFLHDDERDVNYVNMYSNSDKTGSGDGAGSMYMYNRNLSAVNQMGPYGMAEFEVRVHEDSQNFNFMMGWFEDPTSGGFNSAKDVALNLVIGPNGITASNGSRSDNLATIVPEKWYKIRVTIDNNFGEYSAAVTDLATGKVIGQVTENPYTAEMPSTVSGIKTTCWGYIRGNTYNYDLTNVSIGRSSAKYSILE